MPDTGALRDLAKLLAIGAATLRDLVVKEQSNSKAVDDSFDQLLEIASALESIGIDLNMML